MKDPVQLFEQSIAPTDSRRRIFLIGLAVWLLVSASDRISRVLGKTGINVMTRLMGLILAAIAVEVMADGLTKLFPGLAGSIPR